MASWATLSGCRESKTDDGQADASTASTALTPISSETEPAALAPSLDDVRDEVEVDGGQDAGPRRRRRLDASAEAAPPAVARPKPLEEPIGRTGKLKKPMGDDMPYRGAASAAPILEKKPLPADDPWAKAP